ncbi:MAG: flagellar M-ring protein FliF [Rhodocyclaceae bacterium]|nr:flagellar M-ring protein FliF [Rhodocyclaceae bacterium]
MAAEELAAPLPTANPFQPLVDALNRLDARQKMLGAVALALMIALLVGGLLWTREPPYAVLFSNFEERDGGDIVAALTQQNIPHKISDNGRAILVPQAQVHNVRLKLASAGLPKGGMIGFEIMENQKIGISQFAEQINYQRGLEGELSRSVASLSSLQGARVHLAIPKQTAFLRDDQKASASVIVNLRPGRVLEAGQISGIVHLVSSSVPQLNSANVSVIDQNGSLISQKRGALGDAGLDPSQRTYVRDLEADFAKRVQAILAPVVGSENVRAQVTADVDFSVTEQTAENYKPNPTPETVIRSQQTAESGNGTPGALGIPGALTNQPPVPATAPITTPPVPAGSGTGTGGTSTNNIAYTRNATVNYEVDKVIKHSRGVPGVIKRLSVAIVINEPTKTDAKSGKTVPDPLPEAKIKQINDLAREAIGFSNERGDTLNVAAAPFAAEKPSDVSGIPVWQDAELIALIKELGRYLIIAAALFYIWSNWLKGIIARLLPPPPKPETEEERAAREAEEMVDLQSVEIHDAQTIYQKKIDAAREFAKRDPKAVAHMIKEWMDAGGT